MKKYKSRMLVLWAIAITAYCAFAWLTEYDFKLLELIVITNLLGIIHLFNENDLQRVRVKDPVSFVRFSEGNIEFSEVSIPVAKVKTIALETVEKDCYFTLPHNQIGPGKFPSFVFPSKKLEEFKSHILAGLGPVEIIT